MTRVNGGHPAATEVLELIKPRQPTVQTLLLQVAVRLVVDEVSRQQRTLARNKERGDVPAFTLAELHHLDAGACDQDFLLCKNFRSYELPGSFESEFFLEKGEH